jgi:glycosyltransferase involved in cell wall biosynthesis
MKSVLLITNTLPGSGTTAGNALERILKSIGVFYDIKYIVIAPGGILTSKTALPYQTFFAAGPLEDWSSIEPFSAVAEILSSQEAKRIGERINAIVKVMAPTFIILDIQSHTVLKSIEHLNFGNSKLVVILWDHWKWRYREFKSASSTIRSLDRIRHKVLRSANKIIVPSEEFKQFLSREELADLESISVVHLPVKRSEYKFLPGPAARAANKTRIIGFAGQQYARREIQDLVAAVKQINLLPSQLYRLEIHIFGNVNFLESDEDVVFHGFVDQHILAEKLSTCEVLFLPYPFDQSLKLVSELSFPSKFTNYLQAQRPVIFYGPTYSPLSRLLVERGYPFIIGHRSVGTLVHTLRRALDDYELQRKSESIILDLLENEFSSKNFQDSLESAGFMSSNYVEIDSYQKPFEVVSWEPLLISNQLARLVRPLLPLLAKLRHIRKRYSPMSILMYLMRRYKGYSDKRIKYSSGNTRLEKLWKNGDKQRREGKEL